MKPAPKISIKKPSKLFGLVLSGGTSARMGKDKGLEDYHGIPQREHLYHLLRKVCDNVFLSVQESQLTTIPEGFNTIVDQNKYQGPFNGILSAFDAHSDVGWFVLACDLPLMSLEALEQLVADRHPNKSATSFVNPETGEPEPLACIWEPKGLKNAIIFLKESDYASPKKYLMQTDIGLINPMNELILFNANSPMDRDFVKKKLVEEEGS
nr:NTP transferase domain-containing protein [uncultured Allomuricauda sp.]